MGSGGGEKCLGFESRNMVDGIGSGRMVWTVDRLAPCFHITAVATSARLLGDEETDVVVGMVGGFKAA